MPELPEVSTLSKFVVVDYNKFLKEACLFASPSRTWLCKNVETIKENYA